MISEKIDKHNLKAFIKAYVQGLVPQLGPWSNTSVCGEYDIYCVLFVVGCDGSRKGKARRLREFVKLAKRTVPQVRDIEEHYAPKWVQFAYVDVLEDVVLRPLCVAGGNGTELVVTSDGQTMMRRVEMSLGELDDQLLFELVERVLSHEAEEPAMEAPRIIPPPPERRSSVEEVVEFLEELDWKDKDLQLNVVIVAGLVTMLAVCKNCGLKGAVMTLFAMSIFGGMLPTIMALFTNMGGGPGAGAGGRRRR